MRRIGSAALHWVGALCVAAPASALASAQVVVGSPSAAEGNSGTTVLSFPINRSGDLGSQIFLHYQTNDGTAVAPADYVSPPNSELAIPGGQANATIGITVNGDTAPESDESFALQITEAFALGPDPSFGPFTLFEVGDLAHQVALGNIPVSVLMADLNGDGKPDLATADSNSNAVGVLLNTTPPGASSPTFSDPVSFGGFSAPSSIAAGDLNGDGKPDLVVANGGQNLIAGHVSVMLNTTAPGAATPGFASIDLGSIGCSPNHVAVGDLNRDGKPDIAAACDQSIVLLRNTTAPGSTAPDFTVAANITGFGDNGLVVFVTLGDLNNDGGPDLLISQASGLVHGLLDLTAAGATTFSLGATWSTRVGDWPTSIAVADVNGDGKPDLTISINSTQSGGPSRTDVLLNTTRSDAGVPSFASPYELVLGGADFLVVADINADGKPDIAVSNLSEVRSLVNMTPPGAGTVRFRDVGGRRFDGSYFVAMAAGDLNGDGTMDIVMADRGSDRAAVMLNTTTPSADSPWFALRSSVPIGTHPSAAEAGDFNGDGRRDLVVANSASNTASVLLNTTLPGANDSAFGAAVSFATGLGPDSVTTADFNGDGMPDLTTADGGSNNVSVLLNITSPGASTPGFSAASNFPAGTNPRAVAAGDLNGDGIADLAVVNGGSDNVSVLLNVTAPGAATTAFAGASTFGVGVSPASLVLGDINGDGTPDIAVANSGSNNVSVLLDTTVPGSSTASFAPAVNFAAGTSPASLAMGDINGDGRRDLVVANGGSNDVTVLFNTTAPGDATASFAAAGTLAAGSGPGAIALRDLNGDGKPDIAVTNVTDDNVSLFLNTTVPGSSSAGFAAIGTSATGAEPRAIVISDVNNDGQNDMLVVNGGSNTVSALVNQLFTVDLVSSIGIGTILDDDTDRVPDPFAFSAQSNVPTATTVASNGVTIGGINAPAPISVAGGEYSIDGSAFTSAPGNIANGQIVRVRHTSAATPSTTTTTTLTVGGVSGAFTSTTAASSSGTDSVPDAFSFSSQSGVAIGTMVTSNSVTVSGMNAPAAIGIAGGEYSVDGGAFTAAAGSIANGQSVRVRHVSASAAGTATTTTLTIGGVSGAFTSVTATAPSPGGSAELPGAGGGALESLDLLALAWLASLRSRRRYLR